MPVRGQAVIYLDHNATTPIHPRVLEAMLPYLSEHFGNPSSPYRFGHESRIAVERARARVAEHVGCRPEELVFCSSGTESDNLALRGVAHAQQHKGKHIVTTAIEHHAVLHTCKSLELEGFEVTYVPVTTDGTLNLIALAESIRDDTILISVMHANNETGVVQPIEEIAAIANRRGIVMHTDAVQTAGKLPLRLTDLGAALVSFSAHKLYGPKGVAALYVRRGTPLQAVMSGGAQEMGRRAGTENVAGIVGFAEAVALAFEQVEADGQRIGRLRERFEARVCGLVPKVRVNGGRASRVPNTSNLTFDSVDGESIVLGLDLRGICASTGSACSTGEPEPSHVLLAMGRSAQDAQSSVRISLGRNTEEGDVEATAKALQEIVQRLRSISSVGEEGS